MAKQQPRTTGCNTPRDPLETVSLGLVLQQGRLHAGLTRQDLAKSLGTTTGFIAHLEAGDLTSASFDTLYYLGRILGIDQHDLEILIAIEAPETESVVTPYLADRRNHSAQANREVDDIFRSVARRYQHQTPPPASSPRQLPALIGCRPVEITQ